MYSRKMHILAEKHFEEKKILFCQKLFRVFHISSSNNIPSGVQEMVPDHFPIKILWKKKLFRIFFWENEEQSALVIWSHIYNSFHLQ